MLDTHVFTVKFFFLKNTLGVFKYWETDLIYFGQGHATFAPQFPIYVLKYANQQLDSYSAEIAILSPTSWQLSNYTYSEYMIC